MKMTLIGINNVEEYIYLLFDIYLLEHFCNSGFKKFGSGKLLKLFAATVTCNNFFTDMCISDYTQKPMLEDMYIIRRYVDNLLKARD